MPWVEIFIVFVSATLVGDFALQTEWQAGTSAAGWALIRRAARAR